MKDAAANDFNEQKARIREQAHTNRNAQVDKDVLSERICATFMALPEFAAARISQNVLTCATAACFNLLDTVPFFKLGRKLAFFGDRYQFRDLRFGRKVWVVPILGGEFTIDRRFGIAMD